MVGLRKWVLAVAIVLLFLGTAQAQDAVEPLIILPPAGPIGTNHAVSGFDLEPNTQYLLDVIFRDTGQSVYSTPLTTDADGMVFISLFTEPSDALGVYDVVLYDGDTLVREGTITITEGDRVPNTFTGTLRPNLPVITTLTNTISADYYEFQGETGQVVTIDMTATDFDPYLLLIGTDGLAVTWDDSGGDGWNARIHTYVLPASGSYLVAATSRRNIETGGIEPATGEYTLLMRIARSSAPGKILPGEIIIGQITDTTQVVSYTFDAPANAFVSIEVGSQDFDPLIHLFAPDGRVVAVDDDGGPGLNARVVDVELPEAGTYSIMIDGYRGSSGRRVISGEFTIILDGTGFEESVIGAAIAPVVEDDVIDEDVEELPEAISTPEQAPTESVSPTEEAPVIESTSESVTAIETDVTIEGVLNTNTQNAMYTFEGSAGQVVNIEILATGFDSLLRLLDVGGNEIASDDDSGPGLNAAILGFELPTDGVYTIVVDGYRGADGSRTISGTFSLTIRTEGDNVPEIREGGGEIAITYGETFNGTLSPNQQNPTFVFEGNTGDVVTIRLNSVAFDTTVYLLDASGNEIAHDDDSGDGLNALIAEFTLPADGSYMIVVDGYRGADNSRALEGDFNLTLLLGDEVVEDMTTQAQPTETAPAPEITIVQEGDLTYGDQVSGELTSENQQITHTFSGNAGDIITVAVDGEGFDVLVRLLDERGTEIAFDDDSGGSLNALISGFTLPSSGLYTLVVDGYRGVNNDRVLLGTYTLTLSSDGTDSTVTEGDDSGEGVETPEIITPTTLIPEDSQVIIYGETLTGTLSSGSADTAFTFTGGAGDIITIDARSDDFDPMVSLIDENGTVLASDDDSGGGVQAQIAGFELTADGVYYVIVENFTGFEANEAFSGAFSVTVNAGNAPPVVEAPEIETETEATTPETPDVSTAISGGTLAYDTVVEAEFSGESFNTTEALTYNFDGQAGEVITIYVDSEQGIDTRLIVLSGEDVIAFDDDSGAGFDPEIYQLLLTQDATYTIVVESEYAGAVGNIQLSLVKDAPLSLDDGSKVIRFADKSSDAYERAVAMPLMFEGRAGERVRLTVNLLTSFEASPTIEVMQDGELIAENTPGRGNLQVTFDFVVPDDGTVMIQFRGENLSGVIEVDRAILR